MRFVISSAAAVFVVCSATQVWAQECAGTVQFEEDFASLDQWGGANKNFEAGGGKATLKLEVNKFWYAWNSAFAFPSADYCVDVTLTNETADPRASAAGPMFWIKDNNNFYVFVIEPSGRYWVGRMLDGKWAPNPINAKESPDIKKGTNQTNKLGVRFQGQSVTLFINGKEQTKGKLQAPLGSSYVGIFALSAEKSADTWDFTNIKVTEAK